MKILLLSSSFEKSALAGINNSNSNYPLGLAYLHSYLEKKGHIIHSIFLNDYTYEYCKKTFLKLLTEQKPDVVGFNVLTQNRTSTFHLIQLLHKKYPSIRILIGGMHATVMYEQIIKRFPFVIAVLGEGEITAGEVLDKFKYNKSLRAVAGIAYWSNHKIIKTKNRELIKDLDTLPFPKHEAFFTPERTIASITTIRGCPFHCSFCVLNKVTRSYPRVRSLKNVFAEIEYLMKKYPQLDTIWLMDDQFFLINERVIKFCKEVIKRKIKLKFICSGRFKPISKKMVSVLEKAGFIQVLLGLESGSPKILNLCHKYITQDDVMKAVTLFKNTKIQLTTFLIVGLYGETDETVNETIQFVQKIQKIKYIFFGDIFLPIPYPGTELYEIAKKSKNLSDSFWLTDKQTPYFTVEHSLKELRMYKKRIMDSIGLTRILTPSGFIRQYHMIPSIIMFFIKFIPMYPMYIHHVFERLFPSQYLKVRHLILRLNGKSCTV